MPKFNINWLYTIIIIVLAVLFFSGGGEMGKTASQEATYSDFKKFVANGYASKVVINKKDSELKMYVKPENVRQVFKTAAKQVGPNPYLRVNYGSVDQVEEFLNNQQTLKKFNGSLDYEAPSSGFYEVLITFGPTILFIAIWIFLIRPKKVKSSSQTLLFNHSLLKFFILTECLFIDFLSINPCRARVDFGS